MKKILLSVMLIVSVTFLTKAQTILLQENFDSYNGLVTSIPAGFTITWNDTAALSRSYYFSSSFCGVACNSYKFGVDSATIITPVFSNPGSVSFYLKGNGTFEYNKFQVYETPNGSTWNLVASIDSILTSSQIINLPLNSSSVQLKFYFVKDSLGYNAGFDDLVVYGPVGINEVTGLQAVTIFPSPGNGLFTLNFHENYFSNVEIGVINILGKEIKHFVFKGLSSKYVLNLTEEPEGIYLVKIKSGSEEIIRRVIIRN
ncbi:MAG: T9SS type A sorting domain-containing protein [Bacteroidia bacterium]